MKVFRFAGYELDEQRAELRDPAGAPIKLRPKTFEMLRLLAANPGRVLSKQELMEAVWPNIHVGEDGLFQCIREIRTALGDEHRRMVKLVSGRGYLFTLAVAGGQSEPTAPALPPPPAPPRHRGPTGRRAVLIALLALLAIVGLAVASTSFVLKPSTPTIAILPILDTSSDAQGPALAAGVTDQLIDGLAQIDNLRVVTHETEPGPHATPDFEVRGELSRGAQSWTLKLRTIRTATGAVELVAAASVDAGLDPQLQQVRLAAGAGDRLARRFNELVEADADGKTQASAAKVAIEQASASINETSRERFAAAASMLEGALAADPGNVDLQVALAALQTRGIQMAWYSPDETHAARSRGKALLAQAVATRPRSIAVLEAQCRFLTATNSFVDGLVACAKAVSFDPWNGSALYQIGLSQIFLGRFEDALATFRQAERYDTPAISRWTWLLGAGWVSLLLGRDEQALDWLQRSIAITPASGRSHLLLAVAYQRLGRPDDARTALAKALELRPGTTALNVAPPADNTSPAFLAVSDQLIRTMVEIGLPEQ